MELYLIRHTTPDVAKGTCYGHADLDITSTFTEELACIRPHLPEGPFDRVYSSPLQRCRKLAEQLFPGYALQFDDRLKELNCGDWELQPYDDIDRAAMDAWMSDFVNVVIPNGESYLQLYERVVDFFRSMEPAGRVAIVTHAGVVRSLLSYFTDTPLKDSFNTFSLRYGCTVKVQVSPEGYAYDILHNPPTEKERHRPSYY
ncbi:MAG TPA: alpha-ribazole phosphatase [Chitinophagaceae bacterium]|jgi:alpha-ribazole phosphatase|nr:alpha-ribazole phosphatase [Chitinophagaceae bacterium]